MKEIQHCKFSLFRLEKPTIGYNNTSYSDDSQLVQWCFEYIRTYDTLGEAKIAQKEYKQKTIILNSY